MSFTTSNNGSGRQKSGFISSATNDAMATTTTSTNIIKIPSSLTKQCLQLHHPNQRYSNEAVELSSELLRLFVVEARRRAAIEAECEDETKIDPEKKQQPLEDDDDDDLSFMMDESNNKDKNNQQANKKKKKKTIEIRADHVAKIAAELLLDLS